MSQLGNTEAIYGKKFNILSANITAEELIKKHGLPGTSIIYTSPLNDDSEDFGTYSMVITDNLGEPMRLTYTIQPGNGLIVDNDTIKLDIDKYSINEKNNSLFIDKESIVDNNTVVIKNGKISVNTEHLDIADYNNLGIAAIDNSTLKNAEQLYCETDNLDYATSAIRGVVCVDQHTLMSDIKGIVSVDTEKLQHADSENYGISKPDNITISSNDGKYYVNTENLTKAGNKTLGVSKPDNKTIKSKDGVYSVETENLDKASDKTAGVVKIDTESLSITNGVITVNNYDKFVNDNINYQKDIDNLTSKVNFIQRMMNDSTLIYNESGIYKMDSNQTTTSLLTKPSYLEEPINMPVQYIYFSFNVVTNCDFHINVEFINNDVPIVEVTQINYNDEFTIDGNHAFNHTYPSTGMDEKEITIQFGCRNFSSMVDPYTKTTKAKITVSNKDNIQLSETIWYSILRYNAFIKEEDVINDQKSKYKFYESTISSGWFLPGNESTMHALNSSDDAIPGNTELVKLHLVYIDNENNFYVQDVDFNVSNIMDKYKHPKRSDTSTIFYTIQVQDKEGNKHDLTWVLYIEVTQMKVVILETTEIDVYTYTSTSHKNYTTMPVLIRQDVNIDENDETGNNDTWEVANPKNYIRGLGLGDGITTQTGQEQELASPDHFKNHPYYNVNFFYDKKETKTINKVFIVYDTAVSATDYDDLPERDKLYCGVFRINCHSALFKTQLESVNEKITIDNYENYNDNEIYRRNSQLKTNYTLYIDNKKVANPSQNNKINYKGIEFYSEVQPKSITTYTTLPATTIFNCSDVDGIYYIKLNNNINYEDILKEYDIKLLSGNDDVGNIHIIFNTLDLILNNTYIDTGESSSIDFSSFNIDDVDVRKYNEMIYIFDGNENYYCVNKEVATDVSKWESIVIEDYTFDAYEFDEEIYNSIIEIIENNGGKKNNRKGGKEESKTLTYKNKNFDILSIGENITFNLFENENYFYFISNISTNDKENSDKKPYFIFPLRTEQALLLTNIYDTELINKINSGEDIESLTTFMSKYNDYPNITVLFTLNNKKIYSINNIYSVLPPSNFVNKTYIIDVARTGLYQYCYFKTNKKSEVPYTIPFNISVGDEIMTDITIDKVEGANYPINITYYIIEGEKYKLAKYDGTDYWTKNVSIDPYAAPEEDWKTYDEAHYLSIYREGHRWNDETGEPAGEEVEPEPEAHAEYMITVKDENFYFYKTILNEGIAEYETTFYVCKQLILDNALINKQQKENENKIIPIYKSIK